MGLSLLDRAQCAARAATHARLSRHSQWVLRYLFFSILPCLRPAGAHFELQERSHQAWDWLAWFLSKKQCNIPFAQQDAALSSEFDWAAHNSIHERFLHSVCSYVELEDTSCLKRRKYFFVQTSLSHPALSPSFSKEKSAIFFPETSLSP